MAEDNLTKDALYELTIKCFPDGEIQVSGPVQYKIFSLGLLDCAREAICKAHETTSEHDAHWGQNVASITGWKM
jgi:hypothetical protein